ncbi:uncharacterized protein LOC143630033 [Bidens hawaiensis]|uniref:uncharacterized protein LOC143630033 n=1 Tax=Bidens hawaiensis TaxID=980011 RepID=UPI00404A7589
MKSRSHRLPTISDTPDDWGDESWVVDCVCGVDFDDGEEMVDCDECGVWVHTRCSRYVKSEKLFACDKCKSKKLRKESEETEVAQLLVELPTKTLRLENPYPISFPPQNPFQVCSEIPLEEKVHVHGVPGGDTALFNGVSSVFSPQLWKCTGYVPKKFKYQYREFPCWDNKRDDDGNNKEVEIHDSNGADTLFSLSKENGLGGLKSQVNGLLALDMGPPSTDSKKQEVGNGDGRRQQSGLRKEKSLMKPIVIHTGDKNRKKKRKSMEKDEGSKKTSNHASDSVATASSDAKRSESNEGKGVKVLKSDMQSHKHESLRAELETNHKSGDFLDNSDPLENVSIDDCRINPSREAKQMEENDGNQVPSSIEICNQTGDGMLSSLIHNHTDTITMEHEAGHDAVDDANNNGRTYSRSNGTRSNKNNLDKADSALSSELNATIEIKSVEINHQNSANIDLKVDSSKKDDSASASIEMKKEAVLSVSQKVQNVDSKGDEPSCGPTQPKAQMKSSESSIRVSSEGQSKSHKVTVVKSSSKPSISDKAKYFNTDGKQKVASDSSGKSKKDNTNNNASSELLKNGDKKLVKDIPKSSSTSIPKSSHLSRSSLSHAHVPKKNSSDLKDSSADSANSSRSESGAHEQNKGTSDLSVKGEKTSQINRQPAPKTHLPHTASSAAALSDEELALLLHQELNSSPRVPRVPRMRQAGSLPQLASTTPTTSTLMKRTSSSVGKDTGLVSRKKNKESSNNGSSNSREFDVTKKVTNSRKHHENVKNGSAKSVSSGPSSSNEANENTPQSASDEETGPTHRTLPGLIAEIMSKGKRMAYEDLCNAVLPHWPNLRKHNGERYAYSSHSQAVLDCLRNRSEWSRLVDRGPKTNAGRKRRKSDADVANPESEEDYSTDRNTKDIDSNDYPKGKRRARKHRRLALQGRAIKDVRRRRQADVVSDENESSSDSSEESAYSDEEMQDGRTSGPNEASASSDETGTS